MSTLAKTKNPRWSLSWLFIAVFCGIFSIIYETFSHGVYSNAMIYLFAYPLLLGAAVCFVLERMGRPMPDRFYQDGVFTLTMASLLSGILEIYGTASDYTSWFYCFGIALLVIGLIDMFLPKKHSV